MPDIPDITEEDSTLISSDNHNGHLAEGLIHDLSAAILVGGESRRMGSQKASLEVAGKSLLNRVLNVALPIFGEVMICAHDEDFTLPEDAPALPIITDRFAGRGPALGLDAALARAKNEWVFLLACDMPLLSPELIRAVAELRNGYDCVVPVTDAVMQTTCSLYKRSCSKPLSAMLESLGLESPGPPNLERKAPRGLAHFLKTAKGLNIRYIDEAELKAIDPNLTSFIDIDTREDLAEVARLLTPTEKPLNEDG